MGRYIKKINKMKRKREKPQSLNQCSKDDLLRRIAEVMTRAWGKVPDNVITEKWNFDNYKVWLTEPFVRLYYEEYDDSMEI